MSLTGLHTNWERGSYLEDRNWSVKVEENRPLANGTDLSGLSPHFDGVTSLAIGYGFDLLVNDNATINSALTAVNGQTTTLTDADITLLTQARARRTAGTATETYLRSVASQLSISLTSEPAATTLLELQLIDHEYALTNAVGSAGQLLQSKERIAVLSLVYNLTTPTAIAHTIPKTLNAIRNNNRAEAWYEIRYNSNADGE